MWLFLQVIYTVIKWSSCTEWIFCFCINETIFLFSRTGGEIHEGSEHLQEFLLWKKPCSPFSVAEEGAESCWAPALSHPPIALITQTFFFKDPFGTLHVVLLFGKLWDLLPVASA